MTKVWNSQDSQMVFGSFRRPASEVLKSLSLLEGFFSLWTKAVEGQRCDEKIDAHLISFYHTLAIIRPPLPHLDKVHTYHNILMKSKSHQIVFWYKSRTPENYSWETAAFLINLFAFNSDLKERNHAANSVLKFCLKVLCIPSRQYLVQKWPARMWC